MLRLILHALWRAAFGNVCGKHEVPIRYRSDLCPRCNAWRFKFAKSVEEFPIVTEHYLAQRLRRN